MLKRGWIETVSLVDVNRTCSMSMRVYKTRNKERDKRKQSQRKCIIWWRKPDAWAQSISRWVKVNQSMSEGVRVAPKSARRIFNQVQHVEFLLRRKRSRTAS